VGAPVPTERPDKPHCRPHPKIGKRRSLREIAVELAQAGHINERGKPYAAQSIKMMLGD